MNMWCTPWNPRIVPQTLVYTRIVSPADLHKKPHALVHIIRHLSSQTCFFVDRIVILQASTMMSSPCQFLHTIRCLHSSYLRGAPQYNCW